jgi:hypothetical protein
MSVELFMILYHHDPIIFRVNIQRALSADMKNICKVLKVFTKQNLCYHPEMKLWTAGRTDRVITIGHPHPQTQGPLN